MSGSERKGRLKVVDAQRALEVAVLNSDFKQVALGVGRLDVELAPGLYEVQFRAGTSEESQLVKLAGGATETVLAPTLAVPSAAPVGGTSTSHEYHMVAAAQASRRLNQEPGSSGVVVMVRNVRGQDDIRFEAGQVMRLVLVNKALNELDRWADDWQIEPADKWAARVLATPPGGYALSLRTHGGEVAQPLWLSDGWQTLVFIPNTPGGPAPEHATIHMTRMGLDWEPTGENQDIALALEGALWGLRAGRPIVPDDLNLLLQAKFENPILGIVGAHLLLLESEPRTRVLDTVVNNLAHIVPGHPDVTALQHLADEAAGRPFEPRPAVAWPPLLLASYLALLRFDAMHRVVLQRGSPAEDAAARLVVQGLWTAWAVPPVRESMIGGADMSYEVVEPRNPVLDRLSAYVDGAAELRGVSTQTILRSSAESLARATGLPVGQVSRAVNELLH